MGAFIFFFNIDTLLSCEINRVNFQDIIKLCGLKALKTDSIMLHNLTACPHKKNEDTCTRK